MTQAWKPGDKALCVSAHNSTGLREGAVYIVQRIYEHRGDGFYTDWTEGLDGKDVYRPTCVDLCEVSTPDDEVFLLAQFVPAPSTSWLADTLASVSQSTPVPAPQAAE